MAKPNPLTAHWYAALHSPFGIILSNCSRSTIAALYRARDSAADADLHTISIVPHPREPDQLILARLDAAEAHLSSPLPDLKLEL